MGTKKEISDEEVSDLLDGLTEIFTQRQLQNTTKMLYNLHRLLELDKQTLSVILEAVRELKKVRKNITPQWVSIIKAN